MRQHGRMKETVPQDHGQLGLALGRAAIPARRMPRPCSRDRAEWWFQQMRKVIGHDAADSSAGDRGIRSGGSRG
jgi:hypothetical protein